MAQYAIEIETGKPYKIGVAEEMIYLSYDKRQNFKPHPNTPDALESLKLYWRLPVPEDDEKRHQDLYGDDKPFLHFGPKHLKIVGITDSCCLSEEIEKLFPFHNYPGEDKKYISSASKHLNIPCYHSLDVLPNNRNLCYNRNYPVSPFTLSYTKNQEKEMAICIRCYFCGIMWAFSFPEIEPYILDLNMKARLYKICYEYWEAINPDKEYPHRISRKSNNGKCTYELFRWWNVCGDQFSLKTTTFEDDVHTAYFKDYESAVYEWLTI